MARTARTRWIDAALEALAEGGIGSVRIELLAERLGVTKGGFYGYFTGRPQLLAEVLDEWERRFTDDILARVESEVGEARERLHRVGELTASDGFHRVDLAVREWAGIDAEVAKRLRRIDNVRMDFLRSQFATFVSDPDEVEARATLLFALAVGRGLHGPDHPGRTREQAERLAALSLMRPA